MAVYPRPTLLYLDCNGGRIEDIDTARFVYDSLGWNVVICGKSRNHRSPYLNEADIISLVSKLFYCPQVDSGGIVIYGFSGQGAQALGTTFRYPQLFAGVITQCAHHGLMSKPNFSLCNKLKIILITREYDWNRKSNEFLAEYFTENGLKVNLIITEGEHKIGDAQELFHACKILDSLLLQK